MNAIPQLLQFDQFVLDEANARLTQDDRAVPLPPKALAVLCTLTRQPGQLVKKDVLLDAVWGHRYVSESVLKTTISQLRAALADNAGEPRYIETVSRHGYRFIGKVIATGARSPVIESVRVAAPELPAMVGRETELARLMAAWQSACAGESRLIWIEGEAGIGKTTLLDCFAAQVGAQYWARGQCVEQFGAGEPYLPMLEALKTLERRSPGLVATMRQVAPTWLKQMPWLISEVDRSTLQIQLAGSGQDRMVREFWELLERQSQNEPLLLITEDLHWSDQGTLQLMDFFARRRGALRVLWVATFRLTQIIAEEHPLQQLRQELRLHRLCKEIPLDTFSESEVGAFVGAKLPQAGVPESFIKTLHTHTDGLPLFVASVLDSLLEPGGAAAAPTGWSGIGERSLPVPENLTGAIDRQLSRLDSAVLQILEAASVAGMEFTAATIAKLLGLDTQAVLQHCDHLAQRGLWLRDAGIIELEQGFDSRYAFQHALYLHVCYRRLSASRRVQLHRRMAEMLRAQRTAGGEIALTELASHCERGHESLAAVRAYTAAAQNALSRHAPRDAESLADHAGEMLARCSDSPARLEAELEVLRASGVAASLLYGIASERARQCYTRVHQLCALLPQTRERALSLGGLAWVHYVRGELAAALQAAEQLKAAADHFNDPVLQIFSCSVAGTTLAAIADYAPCRAQLERGIALCRALGDQLPADVFITDAEVCMRLNLVPPLMDCGLADEARAQLAAAQVRAQAIGQPSSMMLVHWVGGMLEIRCDAPDAVAEHATALAAIVKRDPVAQGEGPALWLRGWVQARRGEPLRGYDHIKQGYEKHARLGMYAGCPEVLSYATEALLLAEDWDGAQRELDATLALAHRMGERLILVRAQMLAARLARGRNDTTAALAALRRAVEIAHQQQAAGLQSQAQAALTELEHTLAVTK